MRSCTPFHAVPCDETANRNGAMRCSHDAIAEPAYRCLERAPAINPGQLAANLQPFGFVLLKSTFGASWAPDVALKYACGLALVNRAVITCGNCRMYALNVSTDWL